MSQLGFSAVNIWVCIVAILVQSGCASNSDPSNSRQNMVDGPATISIHTEVPLRLFCLSSDASRDLTIKIDRKYPSVSPKQQAILEGVGAPGGRAYNLMLLYLSNIALDYVASGKTPKGISITEKDVDKQANVKCHDWFIGRSLSYNSKFLLLNDGHSTVAFSDNPVPENGIEWHSLNPQTWSKWWHVVDSQLHVSEIFDEPSDR